MTKKKDEKLDIAKYEIAGSSVLIRSLKGREELFIDGVRHKYYQTERGYTLYHDAYSPPKESLIAAVKAYLEKLPKKPDVDEEGY